MERKSFILHETGIFLIGPRTPISNLFYLGKKDSFSDHKETMFCSPSNESSADCPPPKSPLKLARRNQPLSQSARIVQGGGLNDALGTKPNPKPCFAKGNRSFWMKYQIPQSSGTLLTQKHKMNLIIRARCAIWHRSQHALQLGNAEREPIVIT